MPYMPAISFRFEADSAACRRRHFSFACFRQLRQIFHYVISALLYLFSCYLFSFRFSFLHFLWLIISYFSRQYYHFFIISLLFITTSLHWLRAFAPLLIFDIIYFESLHTIISDYYWLAFIISLSLIYFSFRYFSDTSFICFLCFSLLLSLILLSVLIYYYLWYIDIFDDADFITPWCHAIFAVRLMLSGYFRCSHASLHCQADDGYARLLRYCCYLPFPAEAIASPLFHFLRHDSFSLLLYFFPSITASISFFSLAILALLSSLASSFAAFRCYYAFAAIFVPAYQLIAFHLSFSLSLLFHGSRCRDAPLLSLRCYNIIMIWYQYFIQIDIFLDTFLLLITMPFYMLSIVSFIIYLLAIVLHFIILFSHIRYLLHWLLYIDIRFYVGCFLDIDIFIRYYYWYLPHYDYIISHY